MGLIVGKLPRLQFRLGPWMLLNIYLAIVLAAAVMLARAEGRLAFLLTFIGVTTGLPWLLHFLTMLLLRPSPRSDALAISFRELFCMAGFVWIILFMTLLYETRPSKVAPGPINPLQSPAFWILSAWVGLGYLVRATVIFERRCPACRRWSLVAARSGQRNTKRRVLLFDSSGAWPAGRGGSGTGRRRRGRMPPIRRTTNTSASDPPRRSAGAWRISWASTEAPWRWGGRPCLPGVCPVGRAQRPAPPGSCRVDPATPTA